MLKKLSTMKTLSKLLETKYKGYDVTGHRGISEGRYEGPCPSPEMKLAHIEGVNPNLKDLSMPVSYTHLTALNRNILNRTAVYLSEKSLIGARRNVKSADYVVVSVECSGKSR